MRSAVLLGLWAGCCLGCDGTSPTAADADTHDVATANDAAPDAPPDDALDAADDARLDASADADVWDGGRIYGVRADRPGECPASQPIADTFDWAPTRFQQSACTDAEMEIVRDLLESRTISESALRRELSASCFACAYSAPDDATWGVLHQTRDTLAQWRINEGGCLVAAGASQACGRAYNNFQQCGWAACDSCPVSIERDCYLNASLFERGAACQGYLQQFQRACQFANGPYNTCIDKAETGIGEVLAHVLRVMCGRPADGGV